MSPLGCRQFLVAMIALLIVSVTAIAQQPAKPNFPADIDKLHEKAAESTDPNTAVAPQEAYSKLQADDKALYQKAAAMESTDPIAAIRIYRRAARAGSGMAAKRLGEIYDKGLIGVPRNYQEALSWYSKARELGASRIEGGWQCPAGGCAGR